MMSDWSTRCFVENIEAFKENEREEEIPKLFCELLLAIPLFVRQAFKQNLLKGETQNSWLFANIFDVRTP